MPTTEKVLKTAGKAGLSAMIIASKAAKYGLNFTSDTAEIFLGGAKNMADQLAPGLNWEIAKPLYKQGKKIADAAIDQTIALQKKVKGMLD